jgi:F-type H+-transporting ATPase subunit b
MTIVPDWTVFVQIFNFLLLVYLLNLVLFRPLRRGLRDRMSTLAGYEGDIAQLTEGEQGVLARVQEGLTEARREGLSRREAMRGEGAQAEASLLEQVKREVDEEWAKMEKKIKDDVGKARKALKAQAQEFAKTLAAKIVGRELA